MLLHEDDLRKKPFEDVETLFTISFKNDNIRMKCSD